MSAAEVTQMPRPQGLDVLRQPFPAEVVGKLPRVTCKSCSQRSCQQHRPAKCNVCGGYLSTQHIHLDYVGHAEVTDRLLSADPAWNWEPVAWTEDGFPKFTKGSSGELELWIRLTVCGVTRLGVGSVAGNVFDADKQLIGDALRNAAMRFGVALDLWAKEELESQLPTEDDAKTKRSKPAERALVDVADEHGTTTVSRPAPRLRPSPDVEVVDTKPLPEAPTRKRKPPTGVGGVGVAPPERVRPEPADAKTVADVTELITGLKEAGEEWAQRGREAWHAAGVPSRGADSLSQAEAEAAFEALKPVFVEAVKAAPPLPLGGAE